MSNVNPRTRMIDSLAEELEEMCARMKRPSSAQSGRLSLASGKSEDDSMTSGHFSMDNSFNTGRYYNNSKKYNYNKNSTFLNDTKSGPVQQQQQPNRSITKDQFHLELGDNSAIGNSSVRDRDYRDSIQSHLEDDGLSDFSTYIKTPLSPSKAVCGFDEKHNSCAHTTRDHQIYFDSDMRSSLYSSYDLHSPPNFGGSSKKMDHANSHKLYVAEDSSGFSSSCASDLTAQPTHRGIHRFVPRHRDEVLIETGDPLHVECEAEDNWCQGTNLRTGKSGIFPSAHVFAVDFDDVDSTLNLGLPFHEKDVFYVTYLASVEVAHHKGNDVLVQAINKVLQTYQKRDDLVVPASVLLDISFRGVHLIDKTKKNWFRCPNFDYFYSLQNISFCGAHPKQLKYFGFITKHPLLPKFACHVFMSNTSTEPVVEAIGRAFQKSYNEYMAFSHPTEDIYME